MDKKLELLEKYKTFIRKTGNKDENYKWDAIEHFRKHWNPEAEDFGAMLIESFRKHTNLFYHDAVWFYKTLGQMRPQKAKVLFMKLYDESENIEERIKYFRSQSDTLLAEIKSEMGRENLQHSQDERTLSVYLVFRYPEKYYLYKSSFYKQYCDFLGIKSKPAGQKFFHYTELAEDIKKNYLEKDQEILDLHKKIYPDLTWDDKNLIVQNLIYRMMFNMKMDQEESNHQVLEPKARYKGSEKKYWLFSPGANAKYWDGFYKEGIISTNKNDYFDISDVTEEQLLKYSEEINIIKNLYSPGNPDNYDSFLTATEIIASMQKISKLPKVYNSVQIGKLLAHLNFRRYQQYDREAGYQRKGYFVFNKDKNTFDNKSKIYSERKNQLEKILLNSNQIDSVSLGDILIVVNDDHECLGYGQVASENIYNSKSEFFTNYRKVEWKKTGTWTIEGFTFNHETLTNITDYHSLLQSFGQVLGFEFTDTITNEKKTPIKNRELGYSKSDVLSDVFISSKKLDKSLALLRRKKNIILQGPPGTGKTYFAKRLAWCMMGEKDKDRVCTTQFHQSYAYEDFIQGYRPENGKLKLKNGVFYDFAKQATRDPERDYVLIIDEINRGNLSKIFGELMLLIEADKRQEVIKLAYAREGETFSVPPNLHIIGTMNTADRSLALVDYALRRRFAFIHMPPNFGINFKENLLSAGFEQGFIDALVNKANRINDIIGGDPALGQGFLMGHSYFVTPEIPEDTESWLEDIFSYEILPLLEEYWFDNEERISTAKEILGITS